ncbi:hypothetical protein AwDysgo_19180 [Bacteroidales bacterium]|nr:hypothetical protein AwDysgo_19180 [Bacteroidales bacterium]
MALDFSKMMEVQITADGSSTLFVPSMEEHYHSTNGAIQESQHVYIEAGFNQCKKKRIQVLEMGFGTGLNALLTCLEAQKRGVSVVYTSIEKFPLSLDLVDKLNYSKCLGLPANDLFRQMHESPWGEIIEIRPHFFLRKLHIDFADYLFADPCDVVYYDAFAPNKQAEVWEKGFFSSIYDTMLDMGVLTTYCAKGNIRRMLQEVGFTVFRIAGPPGKREMLRAVKD